jgi:hypothetical protein
MRRRLADLNLMLPLSTCSMADLWITKDDYNTVKEFILSQVVRFAGKLPGLHIRSNI